VQKVLDVWEDAWWSWPYADGDPRNVGGVLQAYRGWTFDDLCQADKHVRSQCLICPDHLQSLVKFRLGAHNLR
jgi:hypothetical protein